MNAEEILSELESLGSESTRKTLLRHGAKDPCFGVKVGDLQKIRKRIKTDYQLSLDLYASGNYDAMYLAGLIADDEKMTKADLRRWAKGAYGGSLPGATVPWVATGSKHGQELSLEWIEAKDPCIASIGWATLTSLMSVRPDENLDVPMLRKMLKRVEKEIHHAPNPVREAMNHFVIGAGCFVVSLIEPALKTAEKIGEVKVDHGDTACKTPYAPDYIRKVEKMGRIGKKKKSAKC